MNPKNDNKRVIPLGNIHGIATKIKIDHKFDGCIVIYMKKEEDGDILIDSGESIGLPTADLCLMLNKILFNLVGT